MDIRLLNAKERGEGYRLFAYCFHVRTDKIEERVKEAEKETCEDWGAFAGDGTLAARIINNHYTYYLDGKPLQGGGIGAVSTLPEYREQGAIREIFARLLREAYNRGEVISALYPFNHAFYRKQGYETCLHKNIYTLPVSALGGYRFDGECLMYREGADITEYKALYDGFACRYNMCAARTDDMMKEHLHTEVPFRDRRFSYLLRENGQAVAYITFTDVYHDPMAILRVDECVFLNGRGLNAVLGFLSRFTADYGTVQLPLPEGIELLDIIRASDAYSITREARQGFMVRAVNAKKLLEAISKPAGCSFTVRVSGDGQIAENNGTWLVTDEGAQSVDLPLPDLSVSVQALAQLCTGVLDLQTALLREDTQVNGNAGTLEKIFVKKKLICMEDF